MNWEGRWAGKKIEKEAGKLPSWYMHRIFAQTKLITAYSRYNSPWTMRGIDKYCLKQRISVVYVLVFLLLLRMLFKTTGLLTNLPFFTHTSFHFHLFSCWALLREFNIKLKWILSKAIFCVCVQVNHIENQKHYFYCYESKKVFFKKLFKEAVFLSQRKCYSYWEIRLF